MTWVGLRDPKYGPAFALAVRACHPTQSSPDEDWEFPRHVGHARHIRLVVLASGLVSDVAALSSPPLYLGIDTSDSLDRLTAMLLDYVAERQGKLARSPRARLLRTDDPQYRQVGSAYASTVHSLRLCTKLIWWGSSVPGR